MDQLILFKLKVYSQLKDFVSKLEHDPEKVHVELNSGGFHFIADKGFVLSVNVFHVDSEDAPKPKKDREMISFDINVSSIRGLGDYLSYEITMRLPNGNWVEVIPHKLEPFNEETSVRLMSRLPDFIWEFNKAYKEICDFYDVVYVFPTEIA